MSRTGVTTALRSAWFELPVPLQIGLIYVAARLATTGFLLLSGELAPPGSRFGAHATIVDYIQGWDAQWYWLVAWEGYPDHLPRTDTGEVAQNAWAFMPVYAYVAEWVGIPLGAWGAGALAVSLVSGYLASVVLYFLLVERAGASAALWAVVFFASGPTAALFQLGYAEALFVLLLLLALRAVTRRRFWLLYLLVPVLAYTRPGVLAVALFLGLYGIWRWVRRRFDPLPASDIVHIVVLGALAAATGFSWQIVAGIVTGEPTAYLDTELAWRRSWGMAEHGFIPFQGWVDAAGFWFTHWELPAWLGVVVLVLLVAAVGWLLVRSPRVRALGGEIQLWSAAYVVYLLAVFFPQSSTLRLLMPLSPLWGAVGVVRSTLTRLGVLALCLATQWLWIFASYGLGQEFWQVP